MTTDELERKYDLKLGQYILDWDLTNFYSERVSYRTLPNEFWADVSKDPDLTYNFIRLYRDFLLWDTINYNKFYKDINFIHEFVDWIDWWKFSEEFVEVNDESTIREFIDYIEIGKYSALDWNISLNFIREWNDKINWFDTTVNLPRAKSALKKIEVCDEFANQIFEISDKRVDLSSRHSFYPSLKFGKKMFLRFIRPNMLAHLIWYNVLDEQVLEEFVISKLKDNKEIMKMVFMHNKVSEPFIEKHIDIIDNLKLWDELCKYQKLSDQFIERHKDKIDLNNIYIC